MFEELKAIASKLIQNNIFSKTLLKRTSFQWSHSQFHSRGYFFLNSLESVCVGSGGSACHEMRWPISGPSRLLWTLINPITEDTTEKKIKA